jgi:aldehyde dehydrogenase family 7 protein A1
VLPDANIKLALQSCTFAALGTAGQRCTTTRRLFLHKSIADDFLQGLVNAYKSVTARIGRPEDSNTLIGPLHSKDGVDRYLKAIEKIKAQGGEILIGGEQHVHADSNLKAGNWVLPTIAYYKNLEGVTIIKEETFAPILHVATFETLEEAIELNNGVAQGLSSALFTQDMASVFQWIGAEGSDCGSE